MSLHSILGIARSAIWTHQTALDITGNNIANATTPGYSRQRAELVESDPLRTALGAVGRGVTVQGIARTRDQFYDAGFRRESGTQRQFESLRDALGQVQDIFGEPSDHGIAASLDAFWSSWADLANDPSSASARAVVRQNGRALAASLNATAGRAAEVHADVIARARGDVNEINRLATQLVDINRQITAGAAGGHPVPQLLDERDKILDALGELVPLRVIENGDGTVRAIAGDMLLADQSVAVPLALRTQGNHFVLETATSGLPVQAQGGRLGGALEALNTALPQVMAQLDLLAQTLVTQVNALHRTGTTAAGKTGIDFFSPTGVTADSIALSALLSGSPDEVAAGSVGPGDGGIALQLAALRTGPVASLGQVSIGDFFTSLVTTLGAAVRDADDRATAQTTLAANLDMQRQSVSSVSVDEEMVRLMQHQQAFAAAARIVSVADEMIQDILRLV